MYRYALSKKKNGEGQIRAVGLHGGAPENDRTKPGDIVVAVGDLVICEITDVWEGPLENLLGRNKGVWSCIAVADYGFPVSCQIKIPQKIIPKRANLLGTVVEGTLKEAVLALILDFVRIHSSDGQKSKNSIDPIEQIATTAKQVEAIQKKAIADIQTLLDGFVDRAFVEHDKQQIVNRIQELLCQANARVLCPSSEKPGNLRLKQAGKSARKTFAIDVSEDGKRTSHFSSMTFPRLIVVPAPPDPRRKIS